MMNLAPKLAELDVLLHQLLEDLAPHEWETQTIARLWKVKDVAAHLLDGNIRVLSGLRDEYRPDQPEIGSYQDLVQYLNRLNHEWVMAMKRVSPTMLMELLKRTGPAFCDYYTSLDPEGKAVFPVAWAGEEESKNWMHIAREYTEKFLHQQQIRDAVKRPGLLNETYFQPFLDVCMLALPFTLRDQHASPGVSVVVRIIGNVEAAYEIQYDGKSWNRIPVQSGKSPDSEVCIDSNASWKLFSKSRRYHELSELIQFNGDKKLALNALEMVSFMA